MRLVIVVVVFLLSLSSLALGQTMQLGAAKFTIGMTLEQARKVAAAAKLRIELNEEETEYVVSDPPSSSRSRREYGALRLINGRVVRITDNDVVESMDLLFETYPVYKEAIATFTQQYGPVITQSMKENYREQDGSLWRIDITTSGDSWKIHLYMYGPNEGQVLGAIQRCVFDKTGAGID